MKYILTSQMQDEDTMTITGREVTVEQAPFIVKEAKDAATILRRLQAQTAGCYVTPVPKIVTS